MSGSLARWRACIITCGIRAVACMPPHKSAINHPNNPPHRKPTNKPTEAAISHSRCVFQKALSNVFHAPYHEHHSASHPFQALGLRMSTSTHTSRPHSRLHTSPNRLKTAVSGSCLHPSNVVFLRPKHPHKKGRTRVIGRIRPSGRQRRADSREGRRVSEGRGQKKHASRAR